jgi:hypothetical protein
MVITGAAVCPGAPFLIPGVADSIARSAQQLALACGEVVGRLDSADSIVLLSTRTPVVAGLPAREVPAGSAISLSSIRRSDLRFPVVTLPAGVSSVPAAAIDDPAIGTMVGAVLLAAASCRHPVTLVEVGSNPAEVARRLRVRIDSSERVALLVIADGSACHGAGAPGKRDDRAAAFDGAISAALAEGSSGQLAAACADRRLARELLATVGPLGVLAQLTATSGPVGAELHYSGAPFGVGYWVASWSWTSG